MYLFSAAVNANLTWLAVIAVINSGIAAFYYFGVIVQMTMKPAGEDAPALNLAPATRLALALAGLATVAIGLWPAPIIQMALAAVFG